MFCDRKISVFANVNRVIARVCGGGTQAITSRLRGALPLLKRSASGVMGRNGVSHRDGKLCLGAMKKTIIVLVFFAFIINSCTVIRRTLTTKAVFKVNVEMWDDEVEVATIEKHYLQRLDYLLQIESAGFVSAPIGNGDFFLKYTIVSGNYRNYPKVYVSNTRYLHIIPEGDIYKIKSLHLHSHYYSRERSNSDINSIAGHYRWYLAGYSNDENLLETKILEYYFKNKAKIDKRNKNVADNDEKGVIGEITMTTSANYITFELGGTGTITIDWGDGSSAGKLEFLDRRGHLTFSRAFNDKQPRTITITGRNMTNLRVMSELTALDVSRANELLKLDCRFTKLSELIVSGNTTIIEINCSNNQLTEINFSGNTALTHIDCHNNELTALYLSQNFGLISLNCESNQLTALNVSHSTLLKELNCAVNQITELDFSQNTALVYLSCSYNQLTAKVLNHLFETLHDNDCRKMVDIHVNPGAADCDPSIAERKGWQVRR